MTSAPGGPWRCHHSGPGSYDETARRVDHPEHAIAQLLVQEGHHVRSLPEGRGPGRTPDFLACGVTVEVKAFLSLAERGGRPPDAGKVANKMIDARDQGAVTFISGRGSGLSEATARSGYMLFCQNALEKGLGKTRSIRVLGEGFEASFDPVADLRATWQARQAQRATGAQRRQPRGPGRSARRDASAKQASGVSARGQKVAGFNKEGARAQIGAARAPRPRGPHV